MKGVIGLIAFVMQLAPAALGADGDVRLQIGGVALELREGDRVTGLRSGEAFIAQFREDIDVSRRGRLRERGVFLESHVGGGAYIVRCEACASWLPGDDAVHATSKLSPKMRRSPVFDTDVGLVERIGDGLPLALDVSFFEGIPFERAVEILRDDGIEVKQESFGLRSSIAVETTWDKVEAVLDRFEVKWIEPSLPEPVPFTINAGERTRADQVREQYYFLFADGSGSRVGVWDWFPEASHADLEDRVTWVDVRRGEARHGQLVSGVIAGAGLLDSRAKGIAPNADLFWYTVDRSSVWDDMRATKSQHGITIIQNAWGVPIEWWQEASEPLPVWDDNAWVEGYYHAFAAGADELVRDEDLLLVFAIGNLRGFGHLGPHFHAADRAGGVLHEDVHPPNPEYGSVAGAQVAKNILSIGFVTKDERVTTGSGWGPTNDGRIKPELVAPGLDLFVTDENNTYTLASGSSVSSPVVSGAAALLADYWRRRHGVTPTSLELKNLLIHSARDLGNPGPDYAYGFGLIDVELAARVLNAASFAAEEAPSQFTRLTRRRGVRPSEGRPRPFSAIRSATIDQGQTVSSSFVVRDPSPALRATLAWHDPEGDHLVNDLDLRLIAPNGSVVRPFVLDPSHPSAPAVRGRNSVDNVEHITVEQPMTGTWTVVVEGTRIPMPPQRYSIIVSSVANNAPLQLLPDGRCEIFEFFMTKDDRLPATRATTFRSGDRLNVFFSVAVPENPDYGDYFGSIRLLGLFTNAQDEVIVSSRSDSHTQPPFGRTDGLDSGYSIPAELPPGAYDATYFVRLGNGTECRASAGFSVD